jgi:hypothetical protein
MRHLVIAIASAAAVAGCGSSTAPTTAPASHAPAPAGTTPTVPTAEGGASSAGRCGVERWAVKTLTDPNAGQVNPIAKTTTITALRAFKAPSQPTDRVAPVEMTTWRLANVPTGQFKAEADGDVHLVIGTGTQTMIVEFPRVGCYNAAAPSVAAKLKAARQAFEQACGQPGPNYTPARCKTVTLEGVGFFDRIHGQRGVAPNGIELHPVLSFSAKP